MLTSRPNQSAIRTWTHFDALIKDTEISECQLILRLQQQRYERNSLLLTPRCVEKLGSKDLASRHLRRANGIAEIFARSSDSQEKREIIKVKHLKDTIAHRL